MIISRTPFRVSLFGGGTDYQDYYSTYGSLLIGFAINKYSYLSGRITPNMMPYKSRFSYSKTETFKSIDPFDEFLSSIQHNGIRGVFDYLNFKLPVEISHYSDIPSQTGLGSSSSFIVGLLNLLSKIRDGGVPNKDDLAYTAISIERYLLKEPGGIQDQIWAAHGGLNSIVINKKGNFSVRPLPVTREFTKRFIHEHCGLFYTGQQRDSFVLAEKSGLISSKIAIHDIAKSAYDAFCKEDVYAIGRLLAESWEQKKQLKAGVTTDQVDQMYEELKDFGMIGGKLLGAGGSGFVFGVFKNNHARHMAKIRFENQHLPIDIDYKGSKIIYDGF